MYNMWANNILHYNIILLSYSIIIMLYNYWDEDD
jgi:hypothetical protein